MWDLLEKILIPFCSQSLNKQEYIYIFNDRPSLTIELTLMIFQLSPTQKRKKKSQKK